MIPLSLLMRQNANSDLENYEKLFRSPVITSCSSRSSPSLVSPVEGEPTILSLNANSNSSKNTLNNSVLKKNMNISSFKSDTDAALILASIKKLNVKQDGPLQLYTGTSSNFLHAQVSGIATKPRITEQSSDEFKAVPSTFSKLCSVVNITQDSVLEKNKAKVGSRVRTVSMDSYHLAAAPLSNHTDESSYRIPRERISLDLTTDQDANESDATMKTSAKVSPPSSPLLRSIRDVKRDLHQGPRRLNNKKRTVDAIDTATSYTDESNKKRGKKQQHKPPRPSILRPTTKDAHNNLDKKVLKKKFSWKSYPELEDFLIANREEYLRHSAMNYTSQQKEYNNRLTERLLELATDCGYVFDEESFSFVQIRDRIRCYFKSYVQSKKKRGLILGYAARRKGLITAKELEKSAGIKGTIIVPKKSTAKSVK